MAFKKRGKYERVKPGYDEEGNPIHRVRMPRKDEGQLLGVVEELLGGARMKVACEDGEIRLCRVPGKIRRFAWVRVGDVVILKPWEHEDKKGDIVYRYHRNDADWLRNKGYLKNLY